MQAGTTIWGFYNVTNASLYTVQEQRQILEMFDREHNKSSILYPWSESSRFWRISQEDTCHPHYLSNRIPTGRKVSGREDRLASVVLGCHLSAQGFGTRSSPKLIGHAKHELGGLYY
ncbi:unnamed protein product [Toxocara canis]|uniref:dTDP-4-dehydrorhamnose reductase n=1 Tax=Toxocara canis TaxID=6265 RepID=A0A183UYM5_TOXCA|nr:unnamed protein product [Toxocara canis]